MPDKQVAAYFMGAESLGYRRDKRAGVAEGRSGRGSKRRNSGIARQLPVKQAAVFALPPNLSDIEGHRRAEVAIGRSEENIRFRCDQGWHLAGQVLMDLTGPLGDRA